MNKTIYIVAGANGSGKTTFSKSLKDKLQLSFINADEIAKEQDPNNTTGGELKAGREFFRQIESEVKAIPVSYKTVSGQVLSTQFIEQSTQIS